MHSCTILQVNLLSHLHTLTQYYNPNLTDTGLARVIVALLEVSCYQQQQVDGNIFRQSLMTLKTVISILCIQQPMASVSEHSYVHYKTTLMCVDGIPTCILPLPSISSSSSSSSYYLLLLLLYYSVKIEYHQKLREEEMTSQRLKKLPPVLLQDFLATVQQKLPTVQL